MRTLIAYCMLAASLSAPAWAQQPADPDPSVKTGDGKAAQAKKSDKHPCTDMHGGNEASGGENIESQTKAGKTKSTNCGKDNGKASAPHAAPTTPNPDVKTKH